MKQLERLEIVDRIGRELQSRMGYRDISAYLTAHGVDCSKPTSSVNSKWVHTKDLLSNEPDDLVLRIASELEIPHSHVLLPGATVGESRFWEPGYFRLFLTHLSDFKKTTSLLQKALRQFAVSGFVAHVDIAPTKEWQLEIETALFSMDALVAILMPGFKESDWTEQEVGVAIGRGVLVIPIIRGLDPYGFIGKYQGLAASGKSVTRVAKEVFDILLASERTRSKLFSCLIDVACRATDISEATGKLTLLSTIDLPKPFAARLAAQAAQSPMILTTPQLRSVVDQVSARFGLHPLPDQTQRDEATLGSDDLPF